MKQSIAKLHVANKSDIAGLNAQPLFAANPTAALPMLAMIGRAQLSVDDLLGQLSRQFIEQLLVLSAQTVAGPKHPGRQAGEIRWHGTQGGVVAVGHSKLPVKRPRLRANGAEVAVPAYAALATDGDLSRRIADILVCNVSTRKYARVVHRCADELGISKSAVSRQFVKQSAQAYAKLMSRDLSQIDVDTDRKLTRWVNIQSAPTHPYFNNRVAILRLTDGPRGTQKPSKRTAGVRHSPSWRANPPIGGAAP